MKSLIKRTIYGLLLASCSLTLLFGYGQVGDKKSSQLVLPMKVSEYSGADWMLSDRNGDGTIDYALQVDKPGNTLSEAFDYNYDGQMDDFYIYEGGVVVRREIDSNFDTKIDMWVHMYQGVYIAAYERDSNYDGILDVVKVYGSKSIANKTGLHK